MSDRELGNREQHPTHNEIQQRAYELYLARGCTDGRDIQDWLFAEQQLRNEYQHEPDERVGIRTASFVAGPDGVAKTDTQENDFVIAEEERRQVRAAEQLKKERESSAAPRPKSVTVGQQREK